MLYRGKDGRTRRKQRNGWKKYGIFVQTGEQNCNGATNSGRSYPCGWKTEQG
nr:MAG TPA: hypothetical protein [Caudoviricetes sp.]